MKFHKSLKLAVILISFLGTGNVSAQNREIDPAREKALASIAEHQQNMDRLHRQTFRPASSSVAGNIMVIEASRASGTLIGPNKFDLSRKSVKFTRNTTASYGTSISNSPIVNSGGETIRLLAGETKSVALGFSFPFYRANFRTVFVQANGNLTLGKAGKPPFGLSDFELFHSFPRIAPLDLITISGPVEVTVDKNSTRALFTWKIPNNGAQIVFQSALFRTGDIQFVYGAVPTSVVAITGITPGPSNSSLPQVIDFSRNSAADIRGAVVERFTATTSVDPVTIAKTFLKSQPDTFDFLAFFYRLRHPERPSFPGTGVNVIYQNNIKGIGRSLYNYARVLGTKGRLKAVASFFDFEAYPADPRQFFRGYSPDTGRTPLWLVSHEIGHYWLASVKIMENGARSTNLLSDGCCHWSFTFDADASFLHGNDIRDNNNGTFTTTDVGSRFSTLDQYLMGLVSASAVGPMFYVANPSGVSPADYGKKNVTFSGTRVNVNIDQVVAAEGPRVPSTNAAQKSFNVGFVFIVDEGRPATQAELSKLERLRTTWGPYFEEAASNRIQISTALNN